MDPRAARGDPPCSGGGSSTSSLGVAGFALALIVLTCVAYRPCLDFFFFEDDFLLLSKARAESLGETLHRQTVGYLTGTTDEAYFRPAWRLLFGVAWRVFGTEPRAYFATGVLLHLLVVLAIYAIAVRATGDAWISAAAAAALAVAPTPVQAVAWPSASFNVLPCALLLLGSGWTLWRWLATGSRRALVVGAALYLAAFTFKEAGYHLALLLVVSAPLVARPLRARWPGVVALDLFLVGTVLAHFAFLNRISGDPSVVETGRKVAGTISRWLADLAGLPVRGTWVFAAGAAVLAAMGAFATPRTRYVLAWAAVATLPYAAKSDASRFAYFFHVPLFLGLALFAAERARAHGARVRVVATAGLALLAIWNAVRLPAAMAELGAKGEECRAAVRSLRTIDFDPYRAIAADRTPPSLNALDLLLREWCDVEQPVEWLHLTPKPPFALHTALKIEPFTPDVALLRWNADDRSFRLASYEEVFGELTPLPMFAVHHAVRVVAGPAAALAALRARPSDLSRAIVLYDEPSPPFVETPDARGEVRVRRTPVPNEIELRVQSDAEAFLAIRFFGDLTRTASEVDIDGAAAEILRADGMFNAVRVPAGEHQVRMIVRGNPMRR